jgi:hypothetical protein
VSGQFERDLLHAFRLARGRLVNLLNHGLIRCHLPFAGCYDVLLSRPVEGPQILRSLAGFIVIVLLRQRPPTGYANTFDCIPSNWRGLLGVVKKKCMQYRRSYIWVGLDLIDQARASFSGNLFSAASRLSKKGEPANIQYF